MLRIFFLACSMHFLTVLLMGNSGYCGENKLESLTVSYGSVSGNRGPLWIAQDLGLFEKYGLDVKLVHIPSGSTSVAALIAGNVHAIATAGSSVVAAAAQGAPLVIIATDGPTEFMLVSRPSILSVKDLQGKTIGVSRLGTGPDFLLRRALAKLGMVPGKDVAIVPTGLTESNKRMMVMLQGGIDATITQESNIVQLELQGQKVNVLANFLDLGVYTTITDTSVTRQLLKDRPHLVKAFLMAFCEAIWLAKTDKELALRTYKKHMGVESQALLEAIYRTGIRHSTVPYPLEEAIQADIEFLAAGIPKLRGRKASEFTDSSLLRELEAEGFFAKMQRQQF
jgi:NitT/TauT family transport system substrate-binding protein